MKSWNDKVIRVQDKRSIFVVLDTNSYIEKAEHQINRSSFDTVDADPSPKFKEKVNNWLEKWSDTNGKNLLHLIIVTLVKCTAW